MKECIEDLGFFRFAVSSPNIKIADIAYNKKVLSDKINFADEQDVNLILFPQLILTSASCGSLFRQKILLEEAFAAIKDIAAQTYGKNIIAVIGFPYLAHNNLYSVEAVLYNGAIEAIVPVESSEYVSAYFTSPESFPFSSDGIFVKSDTVFNVSDRFSFCFNTSAFSLFEKDCDVVLCPVSIPSFGFSFERLKKKYEVFSEELLSAVLFVNSGIGESSSHFVFAGESFIIENGQTILEKSFFSFSQKKIQNDELIFTDIDVELLRNKKIKSQFHRNDIDKNRIIKHILQSKNTRKILVRKISENPFLPLCTELHNGRMRNAFFLEMVDLQTIALRKRLTSINCDKCVLGISGGLDSCLALLTAIRCFDNLNIPHTNLYAITMPGLGTTSRTKNNAEKLSKILACTFIEIPISNSVRMHFSDISYDEKILGSVYENAQARERTQILLDKANQLNAIMLGTGDLSETALGWMTYGGDHISMYDLNSSIPKTLIKDSILSFVDNKLIFDDDKQNEILKNIVMDIIATPISPELLPATGETISQKTERLLGPYELHDFFLYHTIESNFPPEKIFYIACAAFSKKYDKSLILKTLRTFYTRFFSQQFKRSCSPEGASVTGFSLSSNFLWNMSSDSESALWLERITFN